MGRFSENDNDIDWEAALFHEQQAAELGVLEAILTLAKLFLGMQPDVLVNCTVDVSQLPPQPNFILSYCNKIKRIW